MRKTSSQIADRVLYKCAQEEPGYLPGALVGGGAALGAVPGVYSMGRGRWAAGKAHENIRVRDAATTRNIKQDLRLARRDARRANQAVREINSKSFVPSDSVGDYKQRANDRVFNIKEKMRTHREGLLPGKNYKDMMRQLPSKSRWQVRRSLYGPGLKRLGIGAGIGAGVGALGYGGYKLYKHLTKESATQALEKRALKASTVAKSYQKAYDALMKNLSKTGFKFPQQQHAIRAALIRLNNRAPRAKAVHKAFLRQKAASIRPAKGAIKVISAAKSALKGSKLPKGSNPFAVSLDKAMPKPSGLPSSRELLLPSGVKGPSAFDIVPDNSFYKSLAKYQDQELSSVQKALKSALEGTAEGSANANRIVSNIERGSYFDRFW